MNNKYDFCLFNIKLDWKRVIWEITNKCNYKCSYCIFSSTLNWKWQELSTYEIFSVIDILKDNEVKYIKFTWWEPFLRNDILEILEYTEKNGIIFDISTNASFLSEDIVNVLSRFKNLSYVHISLDWFDKASQEQIRWIWSFDKTIKWIKLLNEKWIYTRIWTVIYKNNQDHIEKIIRYVVFLWVKEIIFSLMEPVWRMWWNKRLICTKTVSELENELKIYKIKLQNKININYSFSKQEYKSSCTKCPWWEKFMYINSLGNISPCTWISEFFPNFSSDKYLNSIITPISFEKNIKEYRKFIDDLSSLWFYWCPKEFIDNAKEIILINSFINDLKIDWLNSGRRFWNTWALYSFTTENIKWYYDNFDFNNKKCLLIGWSWDHMINAFFRWSEQVDIFDINILSKYYIELKFLLLKKLSYMEFKDFFWFDSLNAFDIDVYKKFNPELSSRTKYFFDSLYKVFNNNWVELRKSKLFNNSYDDFKNKQRYNYYLENENEYNKCVSSIKNLTYNFINTDFKDLSSLENITEYDTIIFWNLSDYLIDNYSWENYIDQFWKDIEKLILNSKADYIIFWYIYNSASSIFRSNIDNPNYQIKLFDTIDATSFEFTSAIDKNLKDKILYYSQEKSLMEDSNNYNNWSEIYEIFSNAEDYPWKITEELLSVIEWKIVLDLWCWTWKYLKLFWSQSKKIYWIDKSKSQLSIAQKKIKDFDNIELICCDANKIPLKNNSVDIIIWNWFFWTVKSKIKQDEIFKEMKRILKKWWNIYFIENSHLWEFEEIRWKNISYKNPTKIYNNTLINDYWFILNKKINTFFKFDSINQAREVFWNIRWESVRNKIINNIIKHKVILFKYTKKNNKHKIHLTK